MNIWAQLYSERRGEGVLVRNILREAANEDQIDSADQVFSSLKWQFKSIDKWIAQHCAGLADKDIIIEYLLPLILYAYIVYIVIFIFSNVLENFNHISYLNKTNKKHIYLL